MLEKIKLMLGIADNAQDERINLIISMVTSRLKVLLGGIEPPEELDNIVIEVAVSRYNRIGSEGLADHTVEGEKQTFNNSDFAPYMDDIQAWLESHVEARKGGLKFL